MTAPTLEEVTAENEDLRARLHEAEELLAAIKHWQVDALVLKTPDGRRVFALEGAEHPYRVLVESMNEGAATLADDGTILYCNTRLSAMLQTPMAALVGTNLKSYALKPSAVQEVLLRSLDQQCKAEVNMVAGDGTQMPVMLSCRTLTESEVPAVCAVLTDLTDARRNQKIIASGKLAKAIIEQAGEPIIVCDRVGNIIRASQSARKLSGKSLLSQSFDDAFVLYREDGHPFSAHAPLSGERIRNIEVRAEKGGRTLWLLLNAEPLVDRGEVIGCVISLNDVTGRRQAQEALQRTHEQLEQRVAERTVELANMVKELHEKEHMLLQQSRLAAMGEMISNIAHQWRQPLNVLGLNIQGLTLFYQSGLFTEEYLQNSVDEAMALIQHMSQTIDDFRDFFRTDKEKVEFRLSDVVGNALKLIEGSLNSRQIKVLVEHHDDPPVYGYPNEYSQVILNVLSNAKDAIDARGIGKPCIFISSSLHDGRSMLTIRDNAGGIPEEIIFKIFDPHFTTKGSHGTGIGLFMAKNIIEKNMNGRISARNVNDGAEFTIEV
jgi:PAS domain S-box-containing protein